jgi:hypothetical protein
MPALYVLLFFIFEGLNEWMQQGKRKETKNKFWVLRISCNYWSKPYKETAAIATPWWRYHEHPHIAGRAEISHYLWYSFRSEFIKSKGLVSFAKRKFSSASAIPAEGVTKLFFAFVKMFIGYVVFYIYWELAIYLWYI